MIREYLIPAAVAFLVVSLELAVLGAVVYRLVRQQLQGFRGMMAPRANTAASNAGKRRVPGAA